MSNARQPLSLYHHGSHRSLLHLPLQSSAQAHVDAIIVPSARSPEVMDHAITLAADLGCALVTLSSRYSFSTGITSRATGVGIELLAIDVDHLPQGLLPPFKTTQMLRDRNFHRGTDTSVKRNLGLLIAWMSGWQRVVFLDDDIRVPDPLDLRRAAALTDQYTGVGLRVEGCLDNSVVCHAYREAGGVQDVFVGAGALALQVTTNSFFPDIYNEDWFFLLDDDGLRPTAVTGLAIQQQYDPFDEDERARAEEFGDILAEGMLWLVDDGRPLQEATTEYWRQYLHKRRTFILGVSAMVCAERDSERRDRKLSSLNAAFGRSCLIKPEWCEDYVHAWRDDRQTWRLHLERCLSDGKQIRRRGELDKVAASLGLTLYSWYQAG